MSKYTVRTTKSFDKQIKKLDRQTAGNILKWLAKNIDQSEDPRVHGKALVGNHKGKWRYRIGKYRVLCLIEDHDLVVLAIKVAHRGNVYED